MKDENHQMVHKEDFNVNSYSQTISGDRKVEMIFELRQLGYPWNLIEEALVVNNWIYQEALMWLVGRDCTNHDDGFRQIG
jgi:hypothetical protein